MRREDLEHLIRAAATISQDDDIVVIGSQAILGSHPFAPEELLISDEADLFPRNHPERADLVDGAMGELSMFHETFGYYAQGVAADTATLPVGWQKRLVLLETPATRGARGWCLEVHDLLVSKYVAGRQKDLRYTAAAAKAALADPELLRMRVGDTTMEAELRGLVLARIDRDYP
ncbi:MAG: DUF6036 family nucleotidyltransferase [Myxococcota bacterium]